MRVGTKSILFGVHCFFVHPWFVAAAWWKLYGFPRDPRLWFAFFLHDIGYWGKPNMDGPEGELHPILGARIMGALFDWPRLMPSGDGETYVRNRHWRDFTLYHSRHLAKTAGAQYSRLAVADKLASAIMPAWFYLRIARWSGELSEYMENARKANESNGSISALERFWLTDGEPALWFRGLCSYLRRWVNEHRDGAADTWTTPRGVTTDAIATGEIRRVEETLRAPSLQLRNGQWFLAEGATGMQIDLRPVVRLEDITVEQAAAVMGRHAAAKRAKRRADKALLEELQPALTAQEAE